LKKQLLLIGMMGLIGLTLAAACTAEQRSALQTAVARSTTEQNPQAETPAVPVTAPADPTQAVGVSAVTFPTATVVTMDPMGTLMAVAGSVPTPDYSEPAYQIVNRGNPHFLEFHAWW
jgi:hypothetical protein